jgi:hypothetical protein
MSVLSGGAKKETKSGTYDDFQWITEFNDRSTLTVSHQRDWEVDEDGNNVFVDTIDQKVSQDDGVVVQSVVDKVVRDPKTGNISSRTEKREYDPKTKQTVIVETTENKVSQFKATTTIDANGNEKVATELTIYGEDGSTWTLTVDENGKVTVTETDGTKPADDDVQEAAAQPVDEMVADRCATLLRPNLRELPPMDKLTPRVMPGPDDIAVGEIDACSPSSNVPPRCTSVWLCLEGTVDADCRCSTNGTGSTGATCDPNTGLCGRADGSLEPAIGRVPIPRPFTPFDLGTRWPPNSLEILRTLRSRLVSSGNNRKEHLNK